jgi:hypothetical protein
VKRLAGEVIPTTERNRRMFTVHRPIGVWAAITPCNFPVIIPMEYLDPGVWRRATPSSSSLRKSPRGHSSRAPRGSKRRGCPRVRFRSSPEAGTLVSLSSHTTESTPLDSPAPRRLEPASSPKWAEALDHGDVRQRPDNCHR